MINCGFSAIVSTFIPEAWFLLAHKHKHNGIFDSVLDTSSLNPMINKMADASSAILLLICWYEVWVKVAYF